MNQHNTDRCKKIFLCLAFIALIPGMPFAANVALGNIYIMPAIPGQTTGFRVSVTPEKALRQKGIAMQKFDYSCGSAALTTLLNQEKGLSLNEEEVIDGLILHGETEKIIQGRRFSLLDVKRYLASRGIGSAGYSAGLQDLPDIPAPSLMSISIKGFKHFVVYQGLADGHIILSDPAFGNMSVTTAKFATLWKQKIFLALNETVKNGANVKHLSEDKLRYVTEGAYYHSVIRKSNEQSRELTQRLSMHALERSGILKPSFR